MAGYQGDEPSNKFVEFVRVSRPRSSPEAIILYDSSARGNNINNNNNDIYLHKLDNLQERLFY